MKRANILRLIAVVAVVVLASMTTGCLKAAITGKIEPAKLTLAPEDVTFDGTLTLTMTGLLGAANYDALDVEFFQGDAAVEGLDIKNVKINLKVSPLGKVDSVKLKDIEGLAVPEALWDAEQKLTANKAKFTVKPGAGFGLDPVVIEVELEKANPV
ncbi:MAG TPA: hypothetical protein DCL63_00605 [Firmicutes bacterium]|jgi:hypothetical protein|nr:hypothetical protein [Bacillota bacterium]